MLSFQFVVSKKTILNGCFFVVLTQFLLCVIIFLGKKLGGDFVEENGVWRTVGGRRIFIKEGQDLASAMKESGKFKKEISKEEKAEQSVLLKQQREKLRKKINKGGLSPEEYNDLKEQIKKITDQKKELDKDLTDDDLKEARHRLEKKEYEKKTLKINKAKEDKIYNKLVKENEKQLEKELKENLLNIEKYEEEYGIDEQVIDEMSSEVMKKIDNLHDDGSISDYVYENYIDNYNEKVSKIMSEKGYEPYTHQGKTYYSMLPKAKKSYDNILEELNKRNLKYKISRSWNPGELPSIYVENDEGNTFRIANHFNNKNQQFEAYSLEENKIYSTKDYINYKETVIKDLEKWLKENE